MCYYIAIGVILFTALLGLVLFDRLWPGKHDACHGSDDDTHFNCN